MWYSILVYHLVHHEEIPMTGHMRVLLLVLGFIIWVLGTVYYGFVGPRVLETTPVRYWVSFALSPIVSAVLVFAIVKWLRVSAADAVAAVVLLALPGMVGEAVVLTHLSTFMPRIQASSGGRYGALLFATYAVVLAIASGLELK
jgi:uncharacterized membrane protein YpjA